MLVVSAFVGCARKKSQRSTLLFCPFGSKILLLPTSTSAWLLFLLFSLPRRWRCGAGGGGRGCRFCRRVVVVVVVVCTVPLWRGAVLSQPNRRVCARGSLTSEQADNVRSAWWSSGTISPTQNRRFAVGPDVGDSVSADILHLTSFFRKKAGVCFERSVHFDGWKNSECTSREGNR